MTRKEAKTILNGLGITNRFSLKAVGFSRGSMQVLTIKDWEPTTKLMSKVIKGAFRGLWVIVEFEGPNVLFS